MGGEKKWGQFEQKTQRPLKEVAEERELAMKREQRDPRVSSGETNSLWIERTESTQPFIRHPKLGRNTHRKSQPDFNFWLLSSMLGIISGFMLWWLWQMPLKQINASRDPGEISEMGTKAQSNKFKSRSRRPASVRKALR
jgi:hypothetical protein